MFALLTFRFVFIVFLVFYWRFFFCCSFMTIKMYMLFSYISFFWCEKCCTFVQFRIQLKQCYYYKKKPSFHHSPMATCICEQKSVMTRIDDKRQTTNGIVCDYSVNMCNVQCARGAQHVKYLHNNIILRSPFIIMCSIGWVFFVDYEKLLKLMTSTFYPWQHPNEK